MTTLESQNPPSEPPLEGEINKQDLIDLANNFLRAVRPVTSVTDHMSIQNAHMEEQLKTAKQSTVELRRVVSTLRLLSLAMAVGLFIQIVIIYRMESTSQDVAKTGADVVSMGQKASALLQSVAVLRTEAKQTKELVEEQTSSGTVNIVPEQDPVKAKKSPLKVVVAPAKKSGGKKPPIAEIPISAESAKGVTLHDALDASAKKN